jgi:AmiR/NasT family two-component response regulator
MTWTFRRHRPTDGEALLAQLALDRAVATIHAEQLRSRAEAATELAANLQVALASSREIGMAMGIVMDRHKLSSDQAFQLLTRISQHRQRRVREIAVEIAETGVVELPKGHRAVPANPAPA